MSRTTLKVILDASGKPVKTVAITMSSLMKEFFRLCMSINPEHSITEERNRYLLSRFYNRNTKDV